MQTRSPHLVQSFRNWRGILWGSLAFVAAALIFCAWEARLPNETLRFEREAISDLPSGVLAQKLENVNEWKHWFHSVQEVKIVGAQKIYPNARLEFQMDPGKGARHRFQLAAEITRFEPGKLLQIRVLDESSGKIFKLVDELTWSVELTATPQGVKVSGTETAHTSHWRSRLFGRLAPRVLMNQLFYPNILILANPVTPPKAEGIF